MTAVFDPAGAAKRIVVEGVGENGPYTYEGRPFWADEPGAPEAIDGGRPDRSYLADKEQSAMTTTLDPAAVSEALASHAAVAGLCPAHNQVLPCKHMACRPPADDQEPDGADTADGQDKVDAPESELAHRIGSLAIPEHFWELPHLALIKQAAEAANVKPEGMFLLAGNRAATFAGPKVVGFTDPAKGHFPLTSINALVGRSGAGSNVTARAVAELLPLPDQLKWPADAIERAEDLNTLDLGYRQLKPSSGSALLSNMQTDVPILIEKGPKGEDLPPLTGFIPRIGLNYTEGRMLLSAMQKSQGSGNSGAGIEDIILDGYFSERLSYDTTDRTARKPIPAGVYVMQVNAYFQAEVIGDALAHTTGLAQRMPVVPITRPRLDDEDAIQAGHKLTRGEPVSEAEARELLAKYGNKTEHPGEMPGVVDFLMKINGAPATPYKRMTMCPQMALEIALLDALMPQGVAQDNPLASHSGMWQYRIAAQSAFLRCSYRINEDDWALAKAFAAITAQTIELCREWADLDVQKAASEDNAKAVRKARVIADSKAMDGGQVPEVVKKSAYRLRDRLRSKFRGETTAPSALNDGLLKEDVADWVAMRAGNTKATLRNAALKWGSDNGLFRRDGKGYTTKP